MKNIVKAFMLILAALIFFGCNNDTDEPKKTTVRLDPTTLTLEVGQSGQIDYPDGIELTWTSSNSNVATVSNGYVTATSPGTATITASAKDGGKGTCVVTVNAKTSDYAVIEGETLVHYTPRLSSAGHFGTNQGTINEDGSYSFVGSLDNDQGGGVQIVFPNPLMLDTWKLLDYDFVEVHFKTTEGSVNVKVKKSGNTRDLKPYPDATSTISLSANTNEGVYVYKTVIAEAGNGIGFQRYSGGPATITIEKAVFSKGTMRTIEFEIPNCSEGHIPIIQVSTVRIPDGRIVNFDGLYNVPPLLDWAEHTFKGWQVKTSAQDFDSNTPITSNLTLVAQWDCTPRIPADMTLNLDASTWKAPPSLAGNQTAGVTWPSVLAETEYDDDTEVLTITFSGKNRERAIIPLNSDQIIELMSTTASGVTFRIIGTAEYEDEEPSTSQFRFTLGDPSGTGTWAGSNNDTNDVFTENLLAYRAFDNKSNANFSYFMIQAMYHDGTGYNNMTTEFPKVIMKIKSIVIDIGNTSSTPLAP